MESAVKALADGHEIVLSGRMTFADHAKFRDLMPLLDQAGASRLVFDMREVSFIDSSALGMLLMARETATARGIGLVLKGVRGQASKIMDLARFRTMFAFEE